MKLSDYAKSKGISYQTAYRMYKNKTIPHPIEQLPTGTIIVHVNTIDHNKNVVLYARVSSYDQKKDLEKQLERLRLFAVNRGFIVEKEISEIGSGVNGKRKKLLKILQNNKYKTIIVEHKDRITRFGFEYLQASLESQNRKILVINEMESKDDLVQDMIDVLTSFCARLYGRRFAKRRAKKAMTVIQS